MNIKACLFFFVAVLAMVSCKKTEMVTPPAVAEFLAPVTTDTYFIQNTSSSEYRIPVGVTTVSDKDRTIQYTLSSPTGAKAGTQYTIVNSGTLIIPAGKAVDTLVVKGLFSGYAAPRKDTLVFTITGGDFQPYQGSNTFTLALLKYCDVVANDLTGSFTRSTDLYNGGASSKPNYTATVSNWTPLTATTARVTIKNMGATSDNGWGPFAATDASLNPGLTATLDWSNPAAFTVIIPQQNYFDDGNGNSTITGTGTFSACDQTFTINAKVKYAGNGNTYSHTSLLRR